MERFKPEAENPPWYVEFMDQVKREAMQTAAAIAALEQAERWEGLIEEAGKIKRGEGVPYMLDHFADLIEKHYGTQGREIFDSLRAVYAALPEPPEGGKVG